MDFNSIIIGALSGMALFFQNSVSELKMSDSIIVSVAAIIIVAAVFSLILKKLKQELIPAYIIAGLIIGPLVLGFVRNSALITSLAEIGAAFLLFVAGLEISLERLKETKKGFTAGILQIVIVAVVSFLIVLALGFAKIEAVYLALIIAFSSTILVVKLLADERELNTIHGRIAVSILIIQDIVAIIALTILSSNFSLSFVGIMLLKLVILFIIAAVLSRLVLGKLFKFASNSTELLFVVSLAFLFLFVALAYVLKISIIIGAFTAGIALANLPYRFEIESKIKPLRDFFAIIFFVSLGMWLAPFSIGKIIIPFLVLLVLTVIFKPLVVALIVRIFGYNMRTSTLTGLSLAQISEFSLILGMQGMILGILSQNTFTIVVLLAIVSMALSPYIIKNSSFLHTKTTSFFSFLNKLPSVKDDIGYRDKNKKTILLFGCHRMGTIFLKSFGKLKENVLVVDYNPEIVRALIKQNVSCIYGDSTSTEIIDMLPLKEVSVAISTIPDIQDNELLTIKIKEKNPNIFMIATAEHIHDALKLYDMGVDYVILPQVISGEKSLEIIKEAENFSKNKSRFAKMKKEHIEHLQNLHKFLY